MNETLKLMTQEQLRTKVLTGVPAQALLEIAGLAWATDGLIPWSHWITPSIEPKRFSARFFVGELPAGQVPTGHAAESDHIAWLRPADAIAAARAGEISLFPPTAATLNDFAVADAAAGADAAGADTAAGGGGMAAILGRPPLIEPVMPRVVREDGGAWLYIPDEVGYPL